MGRGAKIAASQAVKKYLTAIGLLAASVAIWAFALHRGQDTNWDQLNYHFSGVDGVFFSGVWHNIAVSQVQGWFNPLGYVGEYDLASAVNAVTFKGVIAALHLLVVPILAGICSVSIERKTGADRAIGVAAVVIAATGATFMATVGTTFFDPFSAILVLAGLLSLLAAVETHTTDGRLFLIAGLMVGAAVGLKSVNGIYFIGLLSGLIATTPLQKVIRAAAMFGTGCLVGFLLTNGWWMAFLWANYRNPFFPMLGSIFHSPWLAGVHAPGSNPIAVDTRFLPRSALDLAAYPIRWALGGHHITTSEIPFRDPRILTLACLTAACAVKWMVNVVRGLTYKPRSTTIAIWIFFLVSIILWALTFSIQRYLLPAEMVVGVLIALQVQFLIGDPVKALAATCLIALCLVCMTRPSNFGSIPFTQSTLIAGGALQPINKPGALFVIVGDDPLGYVATALSKTNRSVRIDGNLLLDPNAGMGSRVAKVIALHRGPIRVLFVQAVHDRGRAALRSFHLQEAGDCRSTLALSQTVSSCALQRRT